MGWMIAEALTSGKIVFPPCWGFSTVERCTGIACKSKGTGWQWKPWDCKYPKKSQRSSDLGAGQNKFGPNKENEEHESNICRMYYI